MKKTNEQQVENVIMEEKDLPMSDKYFGHFKQWMAANNIDVDMFDEEHYKFIMLSELFTDYKLILYQQLQEHAAQQQQSSNKSRLLVPEYVLQQKEEEKARENNNVIHFDK